MQKNTFQNIQCTLLTIVIMLFWLTACGSDDSSSDSFSLAPSINNVVGTITPGATVTITGTRFSSKENAAPLFWWKADLGKAPSNLGRLTSWNAAPGFNGEASSAIVAPGSSQTFRWDHGASTGAALGKVEFGSETTRLYLHRKLYEDFDVTKAFAIRTRVDGITCPDRGTLGSISPGDVVTGTTSGASGVVAEFYNEEGRCAIFYSKVGGTINDKPPLDFDFGEQMTTPAVTTPMTNSEGSSSFPTGTFRTFNYKTIRFWNIGQQNNVYPVAQGAQSAKYQINRERTDATLFNKNFDTPLSQKPFEWLTEEVIYRTSSGVDVTDALWLYFRDGVLASDEPFISRTAARPNSYSSVFQSQVSNGAQMGSFVYYDSLYIDDSWHRVIICSSATADLCTDREIQIPTSWSDTRITVELNLGGLDPDTPLFLYVLDKDGVPNSTGMQITP
jgi:hypothetical protein